MSRLQQVKAREASRARHGEDTYIDYRGATIYVHKQGKTRGKDGGYKGSFSWSPTSNRVHVCSDTDRAVVLAACKARVDLDVEFNQTRDRFLYGPLPDQQGVRL